MDFLFRRVYFKLSLCRCTSFNTRKFLSTDPKRNELKVNKFLNWPTIGPILVGSVALGIGLQFLKNPFKVIPGEYKKGLPDYSIDEVARHKTKQTRVWVTYKQGVYDITDYLLKHPGGEDTIMQAAGTSVEPFWAIYSGHEENSDVYEALEKLRIGNLKNASNASFTPQCTGFRSNIYANEPERHQKLICLNEQPFLGGPPPTLLAEHFFTPNDLCFICNHTPVPVVNEDKYQLNVEIDGQPEIKTFTLEELKEMPQRVVSATLQCAENRSLEMAEKCERFVQGAAWPHNAIYNAEWKGVLLLDVLKAAGFDPRCECNRHIQFESLPAPGGTFSTSIPVWRTTNDKCDVILAYEMNGLPLSRDHGYPIRVIIPGVAGTRWVKWLGKIRLQEEECNSEWHQQHYKLLSPEVIGPQNLKSSTFEKSPAIQEMPVTSAISRPTHKETIKIKCGQLHVEGYAWSGGGQKVTRVDISMDKGRTWKPAKITCDDESEPPYHWSWALWTITLPIEKGRKCVEIWTKATDSACNTQPDNWQWNFGGVCCNAIHKVRVYCQ